MIVYFIQKKNYHATLILNWIRHRCIGTKPIHLYFIINNHMTKEQIEKIAEEYAEWSSIPLKTDVADYIQSIQEAENILTFLNDEYCIVKKEKVMKIHKENSYFAENPMNPSDSYYQGVIYTLTYLFGTSMFQPK